MSKISISTSNAPQVGSSTGTVPPLSQATVHGGLIFCSGTGALDPKTLELVSDDIAEQVRQTLTNLVAVVEAAGGTKESILKCNCYLTDVSQFPEFNQAYSEFFADCESFPARTTVNAACPHEGVLIEIECVAAVVERP